MAKKRSKIAANAKAKGDGASHHDVSPLNSSVVPADAGDGDGGGNQQTRGKVDGRSGGSGRKKKRRGVSRSKLSEEAALTARLFGGSGDAPPSAAWMDDDDDEDDDVLGHDSADLVETNADQGGEMDEGDGGGWGGGDLFAIDRSGEEVTDDVDEGDGDDDDDKQQSDDYEQLGQGDSEDSGDESVGQAEGGQSRASMSGAAWRDSDSDGEDSEDSDDESGDEEPNISKGRKKGKGVSLVDGPNRLKKLRRYRDETDPLSFKEYELRLRERFMNTSGVAANTDWADVGLAQKQQQVEDSGEKTLKKKKRGYASSTDESSDDEEHEEKSAASRILASNASLFETSHSGLPLPPTLLDVVRTRDGNLSDPNNSVVNCTQFHPGSDEDSPLLMTAGMDKMLRFFRVDGEDNPKVHGIHFEKLPVRCASFLGDTGSVVLSGRRPFFYMYDAVSGSVQKVPSIVGREERSLEKFAVSGDGRLIAFVGNDGYVILVDGHSKRWICDLKMNGSVRAIEFSGDGEYVMGSGSDGDVYKWHIGSRRCVERFHNEDGTITSSLALSSNNHLAVGAESGVVNLYDDRHSKSARSNGGLALTASERAPLKSIMNLTTSADGLRFNHDGQILAMSTRRETNGLKLLHVPTGTVFSNWPTSKTPLKYVWSMDFSPGSRYMAVGNDRGKCLLYRLKHYWD